MSVDYKTVSVTFRRVDGGPWRVCAIVQDGSPAMDGEYTAEDMAAIEELLVPSNLLLGGKAVTA